MNLKKWGIKLGFIDNHTTLLSGDWKATYLDNELLKLEPINKSEVPTSLFTGGYYLNPPRNCLVVVNVETKYEAVFLCGNHLKTYPISLNPFAVPEIDVQKFKKLSESHDYFDRKIYVDGSLVTTLMYR
ncbi:hypothetical protein ABHP84_003944 [Vibrio parahaemolyticus]